MNKRGNPNLKAGPGRPKGSKDKIPRDIKQQVLDVWNKLQATPGKSLHDIGKEKPEWFYDTFGKPLLPKEVKVEIELTEELRAEAAQLHREYMQKKK